MSKETVMKFNTSCFYEVLLFLIHFLIDCTNTTNYESIHDSVSSLDAYVLS